MENIKNKSSIISLLILEVLLFSAAFMSGYFLCEWKYKQETPFPIFSQAYQILKDNGIKQFPTVTKLEYGMIRGMLQAYDDPYTVFVEPPQNVLQTNQLEGKFGGIGARLEKDSQSNIVLFPFVDSPAAQAGILDGDHLIAAASLQITAETSMDDIQAAIRGPVDQIVTIVIARPPDLKQLTFQVKRKEFSIPSTSWNLVPEEPRAGVIHINIMAATTPTEVENAINDLKQRGCSYFILDLRDNYGGLVDSGVNTAALFLKQGVIIQEQYRGKPVKSYTVNKAGPFADIPLVVFVNHNTASSAEIIAGGLQGQKRAQLIGNPTYGKDTIQLLFTLTDGSSIHVTSAHWWVPGIESLVGKGLTPDILLADDNSSDAAYVQAAIQALIK